MVDLRGIAIRNVNVIQSEGHSSLARSTEPVIHVLKKLKINLTDWV